MVRAGDVRPALLALFLLTGCAGKPLAPTLPPPVPAPKVVADLHLHLTMSQSAKPVFKGEPGSGVMTWNPSAILTNQVDEQMLHDSGVTLTLGSVWPAFRLRAGRTALDEALHQLDALWEFGQRRPGFAVVGTAAQARRALARGRIAVLPAVEGGEGILAVDDVDRLWLAGARAITLAHFTNSRIGGASKGQTARNLLGVKTDQLEQLGLTDLGRDAVARMVDLGIVLDLAHASDALSRDVLTLAEERGVPVVNSHSAARSYLQSERSIPDDLAARIARGGGLIGVVLNSEMVATAPESARWPGFVPNTCDEIVAHWLHLAQVAGPDALVLGSDFNGFIPRHHPGGSCPQGIRNAGDLPQLWAALEAHGVPRPALDGMGEKFLALLEKVEAKASPTARAAARQVRRKDADLFAAP